METIATLFESLVLTAIPVGCKIAQLDDGIQRF